MGCWGCWDDYEASDEMDHSRKFPTFSTSKHNMEFSLPPGANFVDNISDTTKL